MPLSARDFLLRFAMALSTASSSVFFLASVAYLRPDSWLLRRQNLIPGFCVLAGLAFVVGRWGTQHAWLTVAVVFVNVAALVALAVAMHRLVREELQPPRSTRRLAWALVVLPLWVYAAIQVGYLPTVGLSLPVPDGLVLATCFLLGSLVKLLHLIGLGMYEGFRTGRLQRSALKEQEWKAKLDVLSEMAHELGTPDATLALLLERLERQTNRQSVGATVDSIRNTTEVILSVIHGARSLLEGEASGDKSTPFTTGSVNDLLQAALMHLKLTLRREGVVNGGRIRYKTQYSRNLEVTVQRPKVLQVFINLLKNCCESFDAQNERIGECVVTIVTVRQQGPTGESQARIEISDNGRGIPPGILPRLMRERVSVKGEARGQGLLLSARVVEDQRGSLSLQSPITPDGRGTRAVVVLPLTKDLTRGGPAEVKSVS
jgi:signal transduction histidine kinase